jgi:hypothetical protein
MPILTKSRLTLFLLAFPGLMTAAQVDTEVNAPLACAPRGTTHTRTTLYFGLARPAGTITERQWKAFVREEVTRRFPQGFTIWQADGQWRDGGGRVARERAKVLLLVHANTPEVRETLADLVATYKRLFQQESVLWETATVCAAF